MTFSELFNSLDHNKTGELSRSKLYESARRLGWHWKEAPILAVFDLLTLQGPISKPDFIAYMNQMLRDPLGPFGNVLLNSPHFLSSNAPEKTTFSAADKAGPVQMSRTRQQPKSNGEPGNDIDSVLTHLAGLDAAENHMNFLNTLEDQTLEMAARQAAVLVIDPQKSFTKGVWMKSIGSAAEREVRPIRLAFENCARFLSNSSGRIETMFTRCPFPPCSYDWDDVFSGIIDVKQLYFIKPGNSVLFPKTNGFREWVERVIADGKQTLVIGGCTLNSCVRISSIESQTYFKDRGLQIVVDLSLSGARTSNFISTSLYGGMSAVEFAVREMMGFGVRVTPCIRWVY